MILTREEKKKRRTKKIENTHSTVSVTEKLFHLMAAPEEAAAWSTGYDTIKPKAFCLSGVSSVVTSCSEINFASSRAI